MSKKKRWEAAKMACSLWNFVQWRNSPKLFMSDLGWTGASIWPTLFTKAVIASWGHGRHWCQRPISKIAVNFPGSETYRSIERYRTGCHFYCIGMIAAVFPDTTIQRKGYPRGTDQRGRLEANDNGKAINIVSRHEKKPDIYLLFTNTPDNLHGRSGFCLT